MGTGEAALKNQVGMNGELILWFNGPLDWTCPPGLRLPALPWCDLSLFKILRLKSHCTELHVNCTGMQCGSCAIHMQFIV